MSSTTSSDATIAALQGDVATLKQDISALLAHLKTGASAGAAQIEAGASQLYRTAAAEGANGAKALGKQIEDQPVLALLVVLGLGYLGGRLLTR